MATFTSYAVKAGVADAMRQAGLEVEDITMNTSGPKKEATTLEDVTTDIVVVGGGPSGLAAAITAKQTNKDANVILVEKFDILSGNGKFDMNFYDLTNSQAQKKRVIRNILKTQWKRSMKNEKMLEHFGKNASMG